MWLNNVLNNELTVMESNGSLEDLSKSLEDSTNKSLPDILESPSDVHIAWSKCWI